MSFTGPRMITHVFKNGDLTAASGKVTFDLASAMTNDGTTLIPCEVVGQLDGTGAMSVLLTPNDDTDTSPKGVQWRVTLRILGTTAVTYSITVPSAGSGPIDLGSLLPSEAQAS